MRIQLCISAVTLFSTLFISTARAEFCAVATKKTNITSVEKSKNKYDIFPGESFTVLEDNRAHKKLRILVGEGEYWVSHKGVKVYEKPFCEPDICLLLGGANIYHMSPNSNETMSGMSGIFKVVSRYKNWYRFKSDFGFGWMKDSQVKKLRVSCAGAPEDVEELKVQVKEIKSEKKYEGWKFGFEGGYYPISRSDSMIEDLTPIPLPGTNVNSDLYDSPFLEQVNDRYGYFVGANMETPLFGNFRNQFSLGYKYKVIQYIYRPNPNQGSAIVNYDQLQTQTKELGFQFIYLTINPKYKGWEFMHLRWQPGVQLVADFLLQNRSIDFNTAPSKTFVRTTDVGFHPVEVYLGPRLDIKLDSFFIAMSANFHTKYKFEPEFKAGFQF